MKKVLALVLAVVLCLSFAACGSKEPAEPSVPVVEGPELPEAVERGPLYVYLDGALVDEDGYTYDDIKDVMVHKDVEGTFYYGATLDKITGQDLSAVKGVFFEAADGFISYSDDLSKVFVAAYATDESGAYQSVQLDGADLYGGYIEGAMYSKGVNKVYLTTTAADWAVEIQVNGTKVGELTMADFLKKTPMGDNKVATGMYDGSFKYAGGASTYQGKFLGFGLEQMVAKLQGMGMEIPAEYTNVEFYGMVAGTTAGKNAEYTTVPENDKYFGLVEFFAMFDGKTYSDIAKVDIGLTAFINGTGTRWMTYDLTAINFVTE